MPKNKPNCDCGLCLFKTFPLGNPIAKNTDKIIEAIIYHFIFRLGSLVRSAKEVNSYVIRFISMINQSYISSNDIIKNIKLIYIKIMVSGTCCKYSNNSNINKLIQKEATYLKIIISSMQEDVQENVEGEKVEGEKNTLEEKLIEEDEVKEDEAEKSFIVVKNSALEPAWSVPTIVIDDVTTVVEDVKTVVEDIKDGIVDLSNEIVPAQPEDSYSSYCVIN